jgi:ferritin-like metal-binding protein YciE
MPIEAVAGVVTGAIVPGKFPARRDYAATARVVRPRSAQPRGDQEEPMAINSPADLFLYELSGMHDAEKKKATWKGEIVGQVRDGNLQQVVRIEQQEAQNKVKNLEGCFKALGTQPRDVPCLAVDGMRAEFQQFMSQNPSPETMQMYAVGSMIKSGHFGIGTYKGLIDKAMLMGDTRCGQLLQSNLVIDEESTGRLERIGHEMSMRVMATA